MDIFGIHEMVITESALITMMQKCRLTRFTWVPHQKKNGSVLFLKQTP